ncbi:hypothetical protein [Streptomyces sp. AF1A]|jgi:hypothetical protein|uniref:hypothetical protein n=1 Tax=Streptomyces sp. AF1A TaxID=3394350 RepID=UPI0039BD0507
MSTATETLRVVEYWTDKDIRVILPVQRNAENDRLSDTQLIEKYGDPADGAVARIVR